MRRSKTFLEEHWGTLCVLVLLAISIALALLRWVGPENPGVAMVIVALGVLFLLGVATLAMLMAENMFDELYAPVARTPEDGRPRARLPRASTLPRTLSVRNFLRQVHAEMHVSSTGSYFAEDRPVPRRRAAPPAATRPARPHDYAHPATPAQAPVPTSRPVIPHRELPDHGLELSPPVVADGYSRPKPQRPS